LHLTAIGIAAAIVVFTLVCDIMVTADVDGKKPLLKSVQTQKFNEIIKAE
jgi:hypothetical protein